VSYSVVICSFNKLKSLKHVVKSLREIGGGHEYILSDDLSTDGTIEWAEKSRFFDKVLVMENPGHYRLSAIRNRGMEAAENGRVVILDGDCVPEKRYFEGHDAVFGERAKSLSVGFTHFYDEKGTNLVAPDHRAKWLGEKEFCSFGWMAAYGGNIAVPKNLWLEVGRFDEDFDGAWGLEDAEFAYRAHIASAAIVAHRLSVVRHLRHPYTGTKEMRNGRGPNTEKFCKKHGFRPC
jgi:GT2 family glycosyltransferase